MKTRSLFALLSVGALVLYPPLANAEDTNSIQPNSEIPNPSGIVINPVFGGGGGGHGGGGNPGHNPGNPGNPGHNPDHGGDFGRGHGNPGHNPGNPNHGGDFGRGHGNPGHNPDHGGDFGRGHGNPGHGGGFERGRGSRSPVRFHGGGYPWRHWGHSWSRPYFRFQWNGLRTVTCIAADSQGYEYPVTETGYMGNGYQSRIEQIEDAAMDRCYEETNGDEGCQLLTCRAGY